jgi:hypothetical protein
LVALPGFACGDCRRLVETTPQRRLHRAPRRLDRTVGLMIFQAFPHPWIFACFLRGLCGQKSAAYAPQGFHACHPSVSFVRARQSRFC